MRVKQLLQKMYGILEISILIDNNDKKISFCMINVNLFYITITPCLPTITDTNCKVSAIMSTSFIQIPKA